MPDNAPDSPLPKQTTMPTSARHIARELALLTLSQYGYRKKLDNVDLTELLEQAIRLLVSEAEDCLKTAGKQIEQADDMLLITGHLKSEIKEDLNLLNREEYLQKMDTAHTQLTASMEKLYYSLELVSSSLDLPLFRMFSSIPDTREFALHLVAQYGQHREQVDTLIDGVSVEWPLDRMNGIDRDVIRLAVGEMLFDPDTPIAVIINEAVELAKKYGSPDSYRFVNGVLKNIIPHAVKEREDKV